MKKTKIIATLGPASSTFKKILDMAFFGVDVFRLNFSHGTHDAHLANIQHIRSVEHILKRPLGIVADLQGPKFRIGLFAGGTVRLETNQSFALDLDPAPGTTKRVSFPHQDVYSFLNKGDRLLLNDGQIVLRVTSASQIRLDTSVEIGGDLSDHKGVNIPGVSIASSLTSKDREDVKVILTQDIDFIALSFVQKKEDVLELRSLVQNRKPILAKIEKPSAIDHLEEIIDVSDGLLVARGDLGVEMPPEMVPVLQKRIIKRCRDQGKPVIVATQMLESMVHMPVATRAEASDVATAVYEGADCVMLSAESAFGRYPLEAVQMMRKIIENVEKDPSYAASLQGKISPLQNTISDAVTSASQKLVSDLNAALILTFTATGGTALREAHKRPGCPILGVTNAQDVARKLTLVWGVVPIVLKENPSDFEGLVKEGMRIVKNYHLAPPASRIIITFGTLFGHPGTTNSIVVKEV